MRVLVIEDERPIADFLVRGLREEGCSVEHAADGESGLHALQTGTWDVVLLDWWLPVIDGLTVLKRYRETGSAHVDSLPDRSRRGFRPRSRARRRGRRLFVQAVFIRRTLGSHAFVGSPK